MAFLVVMYQSSLLVMKEASWLGLRPAPVVEPTSVRSMCFAIGFGGGGTTGLGVGVAAGDAGLGVVGAPAPTGVGPVGGGVAVGGVSVGWRSATDATGRPLAPTPCVRPSHRVSAAATPLPPTAPRKARRLSAAAAA